MKTLTLIGLTLAIIILTATGSRAGEMKIVLRDLLNQQWTNELLSYPFSAANGACDARSLTLTGPQGAVLAQLSDITYWPGTQWVKTAKLAFIANLAPLANDTYLARYGDALVAPGNNGVDLTVTPGKAQVEITTKQFGARLLLGEQTYQPPVSAAQAPGPVLAMRMADGTWFGGSALYGPGKIAAYSAKLTDNGPVFARVAVRYTYENGNTVDLTMRVAAGDNTIRMETHVQQDAQNDGFNLILSRGLPPLILQIQDEIRKDRLAFMDPKSGYNNLAWADIPMSDYESPPGYPAGLVTRLSPWEDWFGTFTQTRIRLRLDDTEDGMLARKPATERELQIRSLNPGDWVEPMEIEEIFNPTADADPAKSQWVGWGQKCMPLMKDANNGEIYLQVNAAKGARKWTISDCRCMTGVAALFQWHNYKPESTFPPETRPTINSRLDEVKDYVLDWPGDAGRHPCLFISKPDLEEIWRRHDADPKVLDELINNASARSAEEIYAQYMPQWNTDSALGAYLMSASPEVAEKTQLVARLRQALNYELWGMQFGCAGSPAPILYDGVIDSPLVSEAERPILRAQMAYYAYRLADPAVWSAERGYCSGNQNMTVTWEISRGITACVIPDHPMAKTWYRKAERIMEYFLNQMVGPAGEWPESMGGHGRTSIDMILAFAVASTNSGMHDYVNDPRVKRMILDWAKMETPRDPRPRGMPGATPNRRYFPAMGRDCIGFPGGTCGVLARALQKTDPALASDLQWAWLEEGGDGHLAHLGGFSYIACDKHLPAKQPAWTSEVFPYAGAMFRHGLGTPNEHQVLLYSGDHFAAFYPTHTGSFANIFAYGAPVAGTVAGSYEYQEGFLTCHVDLAHGLGTMDDRIGVCGYHGLPADVNMWSWPTGQTARFGERGGLANVSSFSTLPRQDYAAVDVALYYPRGMRLDWKTTLPKWPPVPVKGKPPVDWRRQVLFLKDDDPAGANYLLIRDSVKGGQPTMWQMWTVSYTVDTPEKVKDVNAVLAGPPQKNEGPDADDNAEVKPATAPNPQAWNVILPARELPGDRFTAIGQLGVDVEYYVASPTDTPRYTLRWGTEWLISTTNKFAQPEYQDLLHLQMPGDGAYYVAFFPRKRNTPAPTFSTLGEGTIVKVHGDFGTDYGFLSALEATGAGEGVRFTGTAASVQERKTGLVLSLSAKGAVQYKGFGLAADFPVGLRVREKELVVELPASIQPPAFALQQPFPGGTVTLTAPGNWVLDKPLPGVKLVKNVEGFVLQVPAGCKAVTLAKVK